MSSPRTRLAIIAVVVVALLGGVVLWTQRSTEPAAVAAQESPGTIVPISLPARPALYA